ncbi:MAG: glycosyltransferase family 4 protein [Chthoniobacterales bacterium]|nr:glycosyltransferase family 4 protein [Chthoniobacterales bacterium]
MRVLYDGFIFGLQGAGGINRYFSELISRLPSGDLPVVYGSFARSLQVPRHPRISVRRLFRFGRLAEPYAAKWASGFDVFHPTYYHLTPPLAWSRVRSPVVLTVHDFTFERLGHRHEKSAKLLAAQKTAIGRADLIICVSRSTQADLHEFYPQAAERSRVIHLAAPELPAGIPPEEDGPYILFVGSRSFYKNFSLAVRALSALSKRTCGLRLVVAGTPWTESEIRLIHEEGVGGLVTLVESPGDEQLAGLYAAAVCLLYPSEYEGFGLPLLEAMSVGTPVIALRSSSIPEVAGPGAILLDPCDASPENVADAMQQLLEEPSLREKLSSAGRKHASLFGWEYTASETIDAYRSVCRGG